MDELSDAQTDVADIADLISQNNTLADVDDDELEKELESLLYQNDTEDTADLLDGLSVKQSPEKINSDNLTPSLDI